MKTPWIETPLVRSTALSRAAGCNIYLKLENLQPSGSFKSRGVGNFLRSALSRLETPSTNESGPCRGGALAVHFYSSSGGNAGLGCVHAAVTLGYPATIVVPLSTTEYMISKLRAAGAEEVIQQGASWAEADQYLVENVLPEAEAKGEHAIYVPPFDAQDIWDGNATIVHELGKQLEHVNNSYPADFLPEEISRPQATLDAVVCSVGGGGLFVGIMEGLRDIGRPDTRVVAVETEGADSLSQAVKKGKLITLPGITSIATSLGARKVCQKAFEYGMFESVICKVLTDAEAVDGCRKLLEDERILVEPACGVSVELCYDGRLKQLLPEITKESNVIVIVCGGSNISLEILQKYMKSYG